MKWMFVKPIQHSQTKHTTSHSESLLKIKWHPLTARRAIFAAWVLGQEKDAEVIAKIAADPKVDFRTRKDALIALLEWNNPPVPDPVTGFARTLPKNRIKLDSSIIKDLEGLLDGIDKSSIDLIPRALTLSEQDQIPLGELRLTRYLKNEKYPEEARVKSMKLLSPLKESSSVWPFTLQKLFADKSDKVRSMARELLFKNDPDRATAQLGDLLTSKKATLKEKQLTLQTLTKLKTPKAREMIKVALDQLITGKAESGLALDIVTAAETVALSLDEFRASLAKDDPNARVESPLSRWRETSNWAKKSSTNTEQLNVNAAIPCTELAGMLAPSSEPSVKNMILPTYCVRLSILAPKLLTDMALALLP